MEAQKRQLWVKAMTLRNAWTLETKKEASKGKGLRLCVLMGQKDSTRLPYLFLQP